MYLLAKLSVLMSDSTFSFYRVKRAFRYSMSGLSDVLKTEVAFRQEVILAAILTPLALWLGEDGVERALMVGVIFLVLIVELINTAIETAIDRFGTEYDYLSKRAKDLGSAAVFISMVAAVIVWALVLFG